MSSDHPVGLASGRPCKPRRYSTRQVRSWIGHGNCQRLCNGETHHGSSTYFQLDHMSAHRSGKCIRDILVETRSRFVMRE